MRSRIGQLPIFLIADTHFDATVNVINGYLADTSARDLLLMSREANAEAVAYFAAIEAGATGASAYPFEVRDGIAYLSAVGPISHRRTCMMSLYGGCAADELQAAVEACAADPNISGVHCEFDSPGGEVMGTQEAAQAVAECASIKPFVSFVNGCCCSAMYWIAAQGTTVILSSDLAAAGSIGVVAGLADMSGTLEGTGVKIHKFVTGPQKGVGMLYSEVTTDQIERMQSDINAIGAKFVGAVNTARGTKYVLGKGAADGAAYYGETAVKMGLADAVMSRAQVLGMVATTAQENNPGTGGESPGTGIPGFENGGIAIPSAITHAEETPAAQEISMPTPQPSVLDRLLNRTPAATVDPAALDLSAAITVWMTASSFNVPVGADGKPLPLTAEALAAFGSHVAAQQVLAQDGLNARAAALAELVVETNRALGPGSITAEQAESLIAKAGTVTLAEIAADAKKFVQAANQSWSPLPLKPQFTGQSTVDTQLAAPPTAPAGSDEAKAAAYLADLKAKAAGAYDEKFAPGTH